MRNSYLACLLLLLAVAPGARKLSSSAFMLCWVSRPQSSSGVGKCLRGQISEPKHEGQAGGRRGWRELPLQSHSELGLGPPRAHSHCPSPAQSTSPQKALCRPPFPLNPASHGAKKWFWESPQDTSSLIQVQPPKSFPNQHTC